jgi:hypothetical protein
MQSQRRTRRQRGSGWTPAGSAAWLWRHGEEAGREESDAQTGAGSVSAGPYNSGLTHRQVSHALCLECAPTPGQYVLRYASRGPVYCTWSWTNTRGYCATCDARERAGKGSEGGGQGHGTFSSNKHQCEADVSQQPWACTHEESLILPRASAAPKRHKYTTHPCTFSSPTSKSASSLSVRRTA